MEPLIRFFSSILNPTVFLHRMLRRAPAMSLLATFTLVGVVACITVGEPERTRLQSGELLDRPHDWSAALQNAREAAPDDSAEASRRFWRDVQRRAGKLQDFRTLWTGEVRVPRAGMLQLKSEDLPDEQRRADETLFVDVYAFWFCRPDDAEECYLIDSGLDSSYSNGGNVDGVLADDYIIASRQREGQSIEAQLARLNPHGERLQGVFFTHLHGDHTSGVPALPDGLRYFVAENEQYINYWLVYYGGHLDAVNKLEEIDLHGPRSYEAPLLGRVVDLFGDGSLWAVSTPGHSNAHLSYLAMTESGPVLLTGDASHTRIGFESAVEPGWVFEREEARTSLEKLRAFAAAQPALRVVYGHEGGR